MNKKSLFLSLISFYTFLFFPLVPVWAQSLELPPDMDTIPPLIQHEPSIQTAPTGSNLALAATVTDNLAVKEVMLFYRAIGKGEYSSLNMSLTGTNLYKATVPKQEVIEPGVEYYIQASDTAGNVVMRGFSFSPLVVTVAPVLSPPEMGGEKEKSIVTTPPPPPDNKSALKASTTPWYKGKWFWPIVGVVVVGAAVAVSSGGGGGGASSAPTSSGSVTLVVLSP